LKLSNRKREDKITKRLRNVIDYYLEKSNYPLHIEGKDYSKEELKNWHFKIVSKNNFPTAAGLASSSSGIACLGN
jgi:mevalonate pyrophosphate decarboxylase